MSIVIIFYRGEDKMFPPTRYINVGYFPKNGTMLVHFSPVYTVIFCY